MNIPYVAFCVHFNALVNFSFWLLMHSHLGPSPVRDFGAFKLPSSHFHMPELYCIATTVPSECTESTLGWRCSKNFSWQPEKNLQLNADPEIGQKCELGLQGTLCISFKTHGWIHTLKCSRTEWACAVFPLLHSSPPLKAEKVKSLSPQRDWFT